MSKYITNTYSSCPGQDNGVPASPRLTLACARLVNKTGRHDNVIVNYAWTNSSWYRQPEGTQRASSTTSTVNVCSDCNKFFFAMDLLTNNIFQWQFNSKSVNKCTCSQLICVNKQGNTFTKIVQPAFVTGWNAPSEPSTDDVVLTARISSCFTGKVHYIARWMLLLKY